jgi:hypothetical protein
MDLILFSLVLLQLVVDTVVMAPLPVMLVALVVAVGHQMVLLVPQTLMVVSELVGKVITVMPVVVSIRVLAAAAAQVKQAVPM